MDQGEDSALVDKGPCEDCGSSDACATYDDGHKYCYSCSKYTPGDGAATPTRSSVRMPSDFIQGDYMPLTKRGITAETCRKFGYQVGKDSQGRWVSLANYRDRASGLEIVAQKIKRPGDKTSMPVIGDIDAAGLFGQHLWRNGGDWIVITEGEEDAMSVAQVFPTRPVVSIKRGAKGAVKDVRQSLEFLEGYSKVILWFDNDEPGREATQQVAALFSPGKVKVVETPQ